MSNANELLTVEAWEAVEIAAKAMATDAGPYAWGEDDAGMADAESDDLLGWVDDCEARLGANAGDFRSAVLDYIAIRCGGEGIELTDYAQALKNVTGRSACERQKIAIKGEHVRNLQDHLFSTKKICDLISKITDAGLLKKSDIPEDHYDLMTSVYAAIFTRVFASYEVRAIITSNANLAIENRELRKEINLGAALASDCAHLLRPSDDAMRAWIKNALARTAAATNGDAP